MPIVFSIERERDFALFTGSGVLCLDDFIEAFDTYSRTGPVNLELYDLREVSETRLTGEQIRTLAMVGASKSLERLPDSKTAVLVESSPEYGLSRMYQLLSELEGVAWDVAVFHTPEEAYAWLGLPDTA